VRLRWLPFEIHPETPPEGAPKPFPPEEWPRVRARLESFAAEVGLPIDPPMRNVNSRFALEAVELVRAEKGDDIAGAFHHDITRAFFTQQADISKSNVIIPLAEHRGVAGTEVEAAWRERRYSPTVDAFIQQGLASGVTGVPAMAWPYQPAIVGMRPTADLVRALSSTARGESI
jgi:predicted DsbA family dithiol-disulfide isomerase